MRPQPPPHRLFARRRAGERRAAIRLGQALRAAARSRRGCRLEDLEGLVGGAGSATLIGAALWWITPFTPPRPPRFAALVTLMGFFGGLVMSAIKRDRGVKDWGSLIEGHGGVLDRLELGDDPASSCIGNSATAFGSIAST